MKLTTILFALTIGFTVNCQTKLQRFSLQYTGTSADFYFRKTVLNYAEFQEGRDAFQNNNDFDSLRSNTTYSISSPGFKLGLMYNFTDDLSKKWNHLIGLNFSITGEVGITSSAAEQQVQTIDSVEVQSSGTMIPVSLVTTTTENERYVAKMNIIGVDYSLRYKLNSRWLFNANFGVAYHLVRMATGQITRVTNYDTQPNVYYSAISYQFDQFGQKLGVQIGQVSAAVSPMILLNAEEKRRNGSDFHCRYYLGFNYGFDFLFGKVNQADFLNVRNHVGATIMVQPISFKRQNNMKD